MSKYTKIVLLALLALSLVVLVKASSTQNSPTSCSGQWSNCNNAYSDNSQRATATPTDSANKTGQWRDYGFSITNDSTITNVVVRADFYASNYRGWINVRVSGDGGSTFGPSHKVGGNTAEKAYLIDVTNDIAWTPSKLSNTNLRVNVTCYKNTTGTNPTCRLDWIPVNVTYSQDTCSDTDGGNYITVFGTASGYYGGTPYSNGDYCVDDSNIMEYYCSGNYKQNSQQSCGTDGYIGSNFCMYGDVYRNYTDYYCSGGACYWNNTCSDTDGGIVYTVKGTASGYRNTLPYNFTDVCLSGTMLMERYCSGLYMYNQTKNCLDNVTTQCLDGACA